MYRRALAKPAEWGLFRRVIGMALVAFLLTGALTLPEVWAATYYVNAGTGSDGNTPTQAQSSATPWKTLGKALGVATSGDVISVAPGTYSSESFPLELKNGVKIEGQDKATTILSAPAKTDVFENIDTALSSNTTLTGFTLRHDGATATSQTLVHLKPSSVTMSPVIDGNVFQSDGSGDDIGIWIDTDSHAPGPRTFNGTISNNTFDGFDDGISLSADLEAAGSGTFSPTISGNTFTNNDEGIDFYLDAYSSPSVDGINLTASPKITGNTFGSALDSSVGNNKDIYLYADIESGNVTTAPLLSGNTSNNSKDTSISASYDTMEADQASGLNTVSPTVTNNSITDAGSDGIYLSLYEANTGSLKTNVTLTGNTITKPSDDGIYLYYSEEYYPQGSQSQIVATVANNSVSNAGAKGIDISGYSFDEGPVIGNSTVTVAGNSVDQTGASGSTGIYDRWHFDGYGSGTLSQVISGNTVTNGGSEPGIYMDGSLFSSLSAANLDIHDNVVTGRTNGNGIELYHYAWPQGSQVLASCNTATNNANGFVVDYYDTSTITPASKRKTPDLGGGYVPSPGLNSFHDNSSYDLVANTDNISAQSNYWGTTHSIGGTYGGNVDDSNALGSAPSVTALNDLSASVAGGVITYTATVTMQGDCGCASTTFKAPTPANTTVVPGSVVTSGGTSPVVQSADPLKVAVGAMGAGDTITVSWQVQANSGYNGPVSEQASLDCSQLASQVKSDDPSTARAPDPTVVDLGQSVTAIPTLDGAGLALLFGLLFLAGLLLVRKRKHGVALLLALGLSAGLALPARAGTQSPLTAKRAHSVQRARSALHAAVLSSIVVQGREVRLALSDGTSLTVARGRVHVAPMKLDKAVKHAMSQRERRRWRRQQQKLRRVDALQSGQALVVRVSYMRDGRIARVLVRPASSLQSAKAEVAKIEQHRALRAQKRAARSGAKAQTKH